MANIRISLGIGDPGLRSISNSSFLLNAELADMSQNDQLNCVVFNHGNTDLPMFDNTSQRVTNFICFFLALGSSVGAVR